MKAELRNSIKDYSRNKNLRVTLVRAPFGVRQFLVRMNGLRWPESGKPVSITRLFAALRKTGTSPAGSGTGLRKRGIRRIAW